MRAEADTARKASDAGTIKREVNLPLLPARGTPNNPWRLGCGALVDTTGLCPFLEIMIRLLKIKQKNTCLNISVFP